MPRLHDVYGVGHALVDLQYAVPAEMLARHGVSKGVMTLVDENRQVELRRLLDSRSPVARASGGSAANTVIGVAGLGGTAYYACRVGDDDWGEFYLSDLATAGVVTGAVSRVHGRTGQCLVFITPDADRTLNTFLGVSAGLGPEQLEPEAIAASAYLYLEGYLLSSESGLAACLEAQRVARTAGTRVSLTLSDPTMIRGFRDRFEAVVQAGVDLLFGNEDEARAYTGHEDRDQAAAELARVAAEVCVTCGSAGALVLEGGRRHLVPGVQTKAVDTTGAGDLFAGGVLFGVTHGHSLPASARLGCYAAAQVVAQYGPRLGRSLKEEAIAVLAG
jgi:sugar/nucleoside kinase (ribokinase family)